MLTVGDLVVDVGRHEVHVGDREIELTPKEFALLALLARWPGRVLDAQDDPARGLGPGVRLRDAIRAGLRQQLAEETAGRSGRARLVAEPGVGYRLVDPSDPN